MAQKADIGLAVRSAGARPGTRGPHTNLFSGGLPVKKAAPVVVTTAERVAKFAETRRLKADAAKVLGLVVEHHARTGEPLELDGFDIAKATGLDFERVHAIRSELLGSQVLRVRSGNAWGRDGLVPGDNFR
ncbi:MULTISPECIES: hypothetical protein [unclassified Methylobacterium]|uniref:hypothetical protein n=1 Tax=unclassified Methylobacterium TaxID=2615210 RepID=UPI0011C794F7|nr:MULTISPECIES: hypothetical protein [unclassified Methylobacterium]TXN21263.1 hypothetical protein FV220_23290 [Methylobacterium sp. WL19]